MGQTRDEQAAYVGRRRASVAAPESGTPATPYVGEGRAATPTLVHLAFEPFHNLGQLI